MSWVLNWCAGYEEGRPPGPPLSITASTLPVSSSGEVAHHLAQLHQIFLLSDEHRARVLLEEDTLAR